MFDNQIMPGNTTSWMIIRTNATQYSDGNIFLIDGGIAQAEVYDPTAIPVPPSVLLLGSGLIGLAALGRRRWKL